MFEYDIKREREIGNPPKLKPYLAIKALLTSIIPTDVTTLNIHEAKSRAPFLSESFAEVIFFSILEFVAAIFTAQPSWNQLLHWNIKRQYLYLHDETSYPTKLESKWLSLRVTNIIDINIYTSTNSFTTNSNRSFLKLQALMRTHTRTQTKTLEAFNNYCQKQDYQPRALWLNEYAQSLLWGKPRFESPFPSLVISKLKKSEISNWTKAWTKNHIIVYDKTVTSSTFKLCCRRPRYEQIFHFKTWFVRLQNGLISIKDITAS